MRNVVAAKALVATAFFAVVLATLPHPASIVVSAADLLLCPAFYLLARRHPKAAVYGLIVESALALTPRQFVQGYVNGVNWPIYIVLPLIAGYVLMSGRALRNALALTLLVALPVMLTAAATLPPGMRQSDVYTLVVFVVALMAAAAILVADGFSTGAAAADKRPPTL